MKRLDWDPVAREMVTALRGGQTRAQLSRRLGYRTNTVSNWEAGRRYPLCEEFLRLCAHRRIDVQAAFERFHPPTATLLSDDSGYTIDRWLNALRGQTPISVLVERTTLSRFSLSRFLRGQARPRLPEFLLLVEAITDRASDLVDALVDIQRLPTLLQEHTRRAAAKRLAFEFPESEALLRVMETEAYGALASHKPGRLAEALGIGPAREREVLDALVEAGVIELDDKAGCYRHLEPLHVDTSAEPLALNRLRAHWAQAALDRLEAPRTSDWFGYSLVSLSCEDLERVREVLRRAYREIRSIAAASEPVEQAALLNLQLLTFASPEEEAPS
ncbi:MAG: DUF4423 domain-containing protein [Myxococcales bacterium]|nr:DUF4423 domain-containing protein [Myxococcales bacterium]MDD9968595.1 DUF4423 domain-containing protein [Myxococcales bacterium]